MLWAVTAENSPAAASSSDVADRNCILRVQLTSPQASGCAVRKWLLILGEGYCGSQLKGTSWRFAGELPRPSRQATVGNIVTACRTGTLLAVEGLCALYGAPSTVQYMSWISEIAGAIRCLSGAERGTGPATVLQPSGEPSLEGAL